MRTNNSGKHCWETVINIVCTFNRSRRKILHADALCCLQWSSGQSVFLQLLTALTASEELVHICKTLLITPSRLKPPYQVTITHVRNDLALTYNKAW